MGQTLQNGIYLPAEGERNCYDGLEGNWRSLDGLISTVSGKASASHTHGNITNDGKVGTTANLPLITGTGGAVQAGAFGNQANTFCEGNDSRLSDARTPLSHTHTKANITDLFNSANEWTGRQTYDAYLKSFGEARADEWASNSRTNAYLLSRRDTDDVSGFLISTFRSNAEQGIANHSYCWDMLENSIRYSGLRFAMSWDSTLNGGNGGYKATLGTNTLGTNPCNTMDITQLKTINGTNPGALSLPSATTEAIDVTNWVTNSWTANYCDAPFDGYISISCFANSLQINNETKAYGMTFQPGDDGFVCGLMPVCSGDHIKVAFVKTQTSIFEGYKFIKANGNV